MNILSLREICERLFHPCRVAAACLDAVKRRRGRLRNPLAVEWNWCRKVLLLQPRSFCLPPRYLGIFSCLFLRVYSLYPLPVWLPDCICFPSAVDSLIVSLA